MADKSTEKEKELARFPTLPTTSACVSRLQFAQPTRRPKHLKRTIETAFGRATVDGKIGQGHIDVLEAIFYEAADKKIVEESGCLQILVDPYKVRVTAGGGTELGGDQLNNLIRDLRRVLIDLEISGSGTKIYGNLISEIEESKVVAKTRGGGFKKNDGNERKMWKVTIGRAYTKLVAEDYKLHYDPRPVAALNKGISQALARHVLTHSHTPRGGWLLDTLLSAVGVDCEASGVRNRRREIGEDAVGLKNLGIFVDAGRVKTGCV